MLLGAAHLTTAEAEPAVTVSSVGAPGSVRGVTSTLADGRLVPMALVAVRVSV